MVFVFHTCSFYSASVLRLRRRDVAYLCPVDGGEVERGTDPFHSHSEEFFVCLTGKGATDQNV